MEKKLRRKTLKVTYEFDAYDFIAKNRSEFGLIKQEVDSMERSAFEEMMRIKNVLKI